MKAEKYFKWFEDFTTTMLCTPDRLKSNYELKIEHTYRVKDNIINLGKAVGLTPYKLHICELIGLFHDLGRFKQYTEFNSFSDSISGSHGDLSVKVLEENNVLIDMDVDSQNMVKKAIAYHNYFHVPENEEKEIKQLSFLIRDADKLDAFFLETLETESRSYTLDALSDERDYSSLVVSDLQNGRQVDFKNLKYKYDRKLGILGLIFDLKFDESFDLFLENNYLQRMFKQLPKDETMKELEQFMMEYIFSKSKAK